MENTVQIIGLDLGRGFVKGYTEFNEQKKECLFKSVVGLGRSMDFSNFKKPIYVEVDGDDYFCGDLAEAEGDNPTQNSKDDKTTLTARKLFNACLSELGLSNNVKIMIGVPNKLFKKSVMQEIVDCYKNKVIFIKDKITGTTKSITILDIKIYRESDAALMWNMKGNMIMNKPVGMITIGFRTIELSYFEKGLKFNDKKSKTIETGNKTVLEYVQRKLKDEFNIMKELFEIDSNLGDYDKLKKIAYQNLEESTIQQVEQNWINLDEMDIFIGGGTALNMKFKDFKTIEDAQMATAKGLWLIGTKVFK